MLSLILLLSSEIRLFSKISNFDMEKDSPKPLRSPLIHKFAIPFVSVSSLIQQLSIYFKPSSIFESSVKILNPSPSYKYTSAFTSLEAIPIDLNTFTTNIFTERALEIFV